MTSRAVIFGLPRAARQEAQHPMIASAALTKTLGLIATFGGIGVLVNVLVVYIMVQVRGERQQNEEYRARREGG